MAESKHDGSGAPGASPRRARGGPGVLRMVGPGLLVAATGVGAGDLATGALVGTHLGLAVLWAVLVGAGLKFVLSEALMRWQLATGQTVLEGVLLRLGRPVRWLFLLYLVPWSWFVGSALVGACGATTHALIPVFADPVDGKVTFGIACSVLGLILVELGGYRVFETLMRVSIGVMFVTVLVTVVLLGPSWAEIGAGLVVPRIPEAGGEGITWTLALIGGVGGTLTLICYGYWIREDGRDGPDQLGACRVDLAVGFGMTALFGCAMVIIGNGVEVEGTGAGLIVALADRLEEPLGPAARWSFLVGAWGAVFSSLLGVWQSVPYVFADFWGLVRRGEGAVGGVSTRSLPYRGYLYALAVVPLLGLGSSFVAMQKAYAVVGAAFVPLLALALLVLGGRRAWIGERLRNRWPSVLALGAALVFFAVAGWLELRRRLG